MEAISKRHVGDHFCFFEALLAITSKKRILLRAGLPLQFKLLGKPV